jgi:hypothetical protein
MPKTEKLQNDEDMEALKRTVPYVVDLCLDQPDKAEVLYGKNWVEAVRFAYHKGRLEP